ncbi:MAG: hypothetical protein ACHQ1E_05535 [Ktedonobacterales bacterium]|jgi:hypothetical protein
MTQRTQPTLLACILVSPYGVSAPDRLDLAEALREQCAQMADRIAWRQPRGRDWPDAILLALGPCALSEAQMVCEPLLAWLAERQLVARMGIGPTQVIAQLAAQAAAPGVARAVATEEAQSFIGRLQVDALSGLAVEGVTPELVARLRHFGLRTLGQVVQLHARDPQALRRQFGAAAGERLAALAQGVDLYPLQSSPAPARVAVRLRFSAGVTPDQALAVLPRLAAGLARRLDASEWRGRALRLGVIWESGAETRARRRLARPLYQPGELTQAAHALLSAIFAPSAPEPSGWVGAQVAALSLSLGDLSARLPAQQSVLFDTAAARSAAAEAAEAPARLTRIALEVAEPLARRYGTPALYRLTTPQPDAILPEERARLVGLTSAQPTQGEQPSRARSAPRQRHAAEALHDPAHAPQPHWW